MAIVQYKQTLGNLQHTVAQLIDKGISIKSTASFNIFDFQANKNLALQRSVKTYLDILRKNIPVLQTEIDDEQLMLLKEHMDTLYLAYGKDELQEMQTVLGKIENTFKGVVPKAKLIRRPEKIPAEISGEVLADIEELEKSFENGCYRASVILCGRLLEIALHRKHFEVTGNDLLEKAPGLGLGKLIAKLRENQVVIDPALNQQIHLINEVRIYSVHSKKESFYPTKNQAQAIVLFTMDVLEKFFG